MALESADLGRLAQEKLSIGFGDSQPPWLAVARTVYWDGSVSPRRWLRSRMRSWDYTRGLQKLGSVVRVAVGRPSAAKSLDRDPEELPASEALTALLWEARPGDLGRAQRGCV